MIVDEPNANTTGRRPGLPGRALMLYSVNVDVSDEQRFDSWYTHEHLPERVGVPGFLRGRRYARTSDFGHQHLAIYDALDTSVFSSLEYLARLNQPTPLTREVLGMVHEPHRVVLEVLFSQGAATGSELAVLHLPDIPGDGLLRWVAVDLAPGVLADTDACGLHLGRVDPVATGAKAATAEGRDAAEEADGGYVLLLDGIRNVAEQAAGVSQLCQQRGYQGEPARTSVYKHLVTLLAG